MQGHEIIVNLFTIVMQCVFSLCPLSSCCGSHNLASCEMKSESDSTIYLRGPTVFREGFEQPEIE